MWDYTIQEILTMLFGFIGTIIGLVIVIFIIASVASKPTKKQLLEQQNYLLMQQNQILQEKNGGANKWEI